VGGELGLFVQPAGEWNGGMMEWWNNGMMGWRPLVKLQITKYKLQKKRSPCETWANKRLRRKEGS